MKPYRDQTGRSLVVRRVGTARVAVRTMIVVITKVEDT